VRLEVAVIHQDGRAEVVNASRPATLVAFSDEYGGKMMPETIREIAWVVHRALGVEEPLDVWLTTLEDISAAPEDVALARRVMEGDEDARRMALGEIPRVDEEVEENGRPRDPAVEQLTEATAGAPMSGVS
jgi:hypothetical protein